MEDSVPNSPPVIRRFNGNGTANAKKSSVFTGHGHTARFGATRAGPSDVNNLKENGAAGGS